MGDAIQIRGLRAMGVHGVLPQERERAQPFEVDLELSVDLRKAGATDDLADTVDYGVLAEAVAGCVTNESYALLERLAERIAEIALTDDRVSSVAVTVKKLEPPVDAEVDHVAVTIERS
jgi:dihydroneopterin aldolase